MLTRCADERQGRLKIHSARRRDTRVAQACAVIYFATGEVKAMSQRKVSAVQEFIISRDPEVMGGTPVFAGTRVPVEALFDHLVAEEALSEFAEGFPRVGVEGARELLRRIAELIESGELSV
jgi:uncharacterized protein (DUF433 family)